MLMKKTSSPVKKIKQAKTPKTQKGLGSYMGVGVRNKVGKVKDTFTSSSKSNNKAPKSLA